MPFAHSVHAENRRVETFLPAPPPKPPEGVVFTVEITYEGRTDVIRDVTSLQYPRSKRALVVFRRDGRGFTFPWDKIQALDVTPDAQ